METTCFVSLLSACMLICSSITPCLAHPPLLGVQPLDQKYYASEVISCKDGSKSFTKNRLNDNFCDCSDGTDEPGTSACPSGKFYCHNIGSTPKLIYSSHVNDRYCDCCDGTDEYDKDVHCPNTCSTGANFKYEIENDISIVENLGSMDAKEIKRGAYLEEPVNIVLKVPIILQVFLVSCLVAFWILLRHTRSGRRHSY